VSSVKLTKKVVRKCSEVDISIDNSNEASLGSGLGGLRAPVATRATCIQEFKQDRTKRTLKQSKLMIDKVSYSAYIEITCYVRNPS